jgi:uncharacterized membrane protein YoaK (UPF0700 family)
VGISVGRTGLSPAHSTVGAPSGAPVPGSQPAADRSGAVRRRHALVVVLTFATGAADALGFLALGGAFSSVMTGNMVLLGLSAGAADAELAVTTGSAILAFVVGLLVGAKIAGAPTDGDTVWPRPVTRALLVELVVFCGYLVGWVATQGDRSDRAALGLLMCSAVALGLQSSAVQRFGVSGLSSTYLTGTLTSLIGDLAARRPRTTWLPRGQVLLSLMAGAALGSLVTLHVPRLAPALCVVPLAIVSLGARRIVGER